MRRRHRPAEADQYPQQLLEYSPADWPASECHPECAYWRAVRAWDLRHSDDPVPVDGGPDTPFHSETL